MTRRERCEALLVQLDKIARERDPRDFGLPLWGSLHEKMIAQVEATLTSTWTTTKPTEEGWYWWRAQVEEQAIVRMREVRADTRGLYVTDGGYVEFMRGEWSDRPIEGPGEK